MAATKKSKRERGQEIWDSNEYLKGLIAQIPEDKRESVLEHIGEFGLRQEDYSRLSDEAQAAAKQAQEELKKGQDLYNANLKWREENQKLLAAEQAKLDEAKKALATPHDAPALDPTKFLSKEEAAKLTAQARQEIETQQLELSSAIDGLRARHFKEFNEYLSQADLIAHARKINKPVDLAYEDMTRERYQAKQQAATEQWKKDESARIEREVRAKLGAGHPYPVNNNEPTTLAGVQVTKPGEAPTPNPKFGVQAAIDAINRGEIKPQG